MADRYDVLEHDSEVQRELHPEGPPMQNIVSAAIFVAALFQSRQIAYAFMGGFAMNVRGSSWRTRDIDLIVQAKLREIWMMIETQPRSVSGFFEWIDRRSGADVHSLIIPKSRLVEGVVRIFVKTGSKWDDCPEAHEIEVDLIQPGAKGSPRDLTDRRELFSFHLAETGQDLGFYCLNLHYMLTTKFHACNLRAIERDYADIKYLLKKYEPEARVAALDLDEYEMDFFLEGIPVEERQFYQDVLAFEDA